jgi:hypothetical protein
MDGSDGLTHGPPGSGGPVVLGPWLQGAWWRLVAPASWHRGGAGDRPGVDGGLDLHRPIRPMVEVERWSAQPLRRQRCLALLSSVVRPRVAQVGFFRRYLGLTEVPGRKPCLKLAMATPAGAVPSLGASSWHCPCCLTTSAGGNP